MSTVKLRAHHLLCIRGFKGRGYSPSFVKNFYEVIKTLKDRALVEVVSGADEICFACPHLKEVRCFKSENNDKKVKALDAKVLAKLNIDSGTKIAYEKISKLVDEKIPKHKLREVCGSCEWIGYCEK